MVRSNVDTYVVPMMEVAIDGTLGFIEYLNGNGIKI